jgi:hypothetical protein
MSSEKNKISISIGWLSLLLPIVLLAGNMILYCFSGDKTVSEAIRSSISDYYYSRMGTIFVGILSSIALLLFLFSGNTKSEILFAKITGLSAAGIVMFPTSVTANDYSNWFGPTGNLDFEMLHIGFAALFFLSSACLSYYGFTKSEKRRTSVYKNKRILIYQLCGLTIIICLILLACIVFLPSHYFQSIRWLKPIYSIETIAMTAIGICWFTKGGLLYKDQQ